MGKGDATRWRGSGGFGRTPAMTLFTRRTRGSFCGGCCCCVVVVVVVSLLPLFLNQNKFFFRFRLTVKDNHDGWDGCSFVPLLSFSYRNKSICLLWKQVKCDRVLLVVSRKPTTNYQAKPAGQPILQEFVVVFVAIVVVLLTAKAQSIQNKGHNRI